ncbi:hypothetical protein XarbCFBP6827_18190 [Xanthomonas arboricola]|nr:hypothetical protein XarbCFBP6827_18190 [Xanthomonas arboricola]
MLFVLFGDMKVIERFAYIDKYIYPTAKEFVSLNLLGPGLSALLYIAVLPWFAEQALVMSLWYQRRQKKAELKSEGLEVLTEDQGAELRQRIASRDAKITELSQRSAVLERRAVRFEVQEVIIGGKDEQALREILLKYLQIELFIEKNHYQGSNNGLVRFDKDGYVNLRKGNSSAMAGVERWALEKDCLVLYSAAREVLGRLSFNSNQRGFFHGIVNGADVVLLAKD